METEIMVFLHNIKTVPIFLIALLVKIERV